MFYKFNNTGALRLDPLYKRNKKISYISFNFLYSISEFNRDLEKDIIGDTSGHFKRLLVSLVQANRSDSTDVDRNKAKQDAKDLYQAGEKKWGTDESKFNQILVSRSYPQLRATFEEYKNLSKKDMEEVLKSEMSGDLLRGMLTVGKLIDPFQSDGQRLRGELIVYQ